jgi:hypothetical protein
LDLDNAPPAVMARDQCAIIAKNIAIVPIRHADAKMNETSVLIIVADPKDGMGREC